jgi:hypothetical protein
MPRFALSPESKDDTGTTPYRNPIQWSSLDRFGLGARRIFLDSLVIGLAGAFLDWLFLDLCGALGLTGAGLDVGLSSWLELSS